MHTTLSRLRDVFPFIGTRPVTEADLFDTCERLGVEVVFAHEICRGLYARYDGRDYIFLNAMLHGPSLLYVFAHELAHAILHAPTRRQRGQRMTAGFDCSRKHAEAEQAAALLLLPIDEVMRLREADGPLDKNLARLVALRIDHWAATGY